MRVLIQTRKLKPKEIRLMRASYPFKLNNEVIELKTAREKIDFLIDLMIDSGAEGRNFENIMNKQPDKKLNVTDLYHYMITDNLDIPGIYIANIHEETQANGALYKNIIKASTNELLEIGNYFNRRQPLTEEINERQETHRDDVLSFIQDKALCDELLTYIDTENFEKCMQLILHHFPYAPVYTQPSILFDFAYVLATYCYQDTTYIKSYIEKRRYRFRKQQKEAFRTFQKLDRLAIYEGLRSRSERKLVDYTDEIIDAILKRTDAIVNYRRYSEGYYYQQDRCDDWLQKYLLKL